MENKIQATKIKYKTIKYMSIYKKMKKENNNNKI